MLPLPLTRMEARDVPCRSHSDLARCTHRRRRRRRRHLLAQSVRQVRISSFCSHGVDSTDAHTTLVTGTAANRYRNDQKTPTARQKMAASKPALDIEEAVKPLPAEGPSLEAVEKEPVSEDASFWKQHCEGLAGLVLGTALGVFLGRRSRAEAVVVADEETPVAVRIHRRTASYPLSDGSSDEEDFLFQSWRSRVD